MHGLWRLHMNYRIAYQRNLAEDVVDCCRIRNLPSFLCGPEVWPMVSQCAYRFMRRYGLCRIREWNALVETIALRCSGNPTLTARALTADRLRGSWKVHFLFSERGKCIGVSRHSCAAEWRKLQHRLDSLVMHRTIRLDVQHVMTELRSELDAELRCELCGSIANGQRQYITLLDVENLDRKRTEYVHACIGCASKARAIRAKWQQAKELSDLSRKLKKAIQNDYQRTEQQHDEQDSQHASGCA